MVKVIAKEADTISTIPSEDNSQLFIDASDQGATTITTILNKIQRTPQNKTNNPTSTTSTSSTTTSMISSRKWSQRQTQHFYKLLKITGTDFTMMANLQSRRSKKQLLNKYKKEERKNPGKVYDILRELNTSQVYLKIQEVEVYQP